jgi:hypothetical protein
LAVLDDCAACCQVADSSNRKVLWSDITVAPTIVTANNKGIVSLAHDPRVSDGKTAHVTITVPSHPDLHADLDIPITYDYNFVANFSGAPGSDGLNGSDGLPGSPGSMGSTDPNNPSPGGNGGNGTNGSDGGDGGNGGNAACASPRDVAAWDASVAASERSCGRKTETLPDRSSGRRAHGDG